MNAASLRRVVIDTDPGIDDAVAILCALNSPDFDIRGITTVAGNIGIATTTRNAGRLLAFAGRSDIPVVRGAAEPLSRKGFDTKEIHGDDGLGGVPFPEPLAQPLDGDAVQWLGALLSRETAGSVDVLALGPLTNIARLVMESPEAAARIGRLIVMGGAIREPGNVGPRAEFNIAADPEAAAIVFGSSLPTILIPLDVTRRVRASRAYVASLRGHASPAARASADLIDAYFQSTTGGESRPLHDPCVMLYALEPGLFSCERLALTVDATAGRDDGALSIDGAPGKAIDVAMTVDAVGALALLEDHLGRAAPSASGQAVA